MLQGLGQHFSRNAEHLSEVTKFRLRGSRLSPNRFVIFARPRSGTTTLVSLLNALPDLFCDGEILRYPVLFPFSHVLARCGNSKSPVFGCKVMGYQVKTVQPLSNREGFIRRLHDKGFKVLYVRRENKINQALSSIRARQFGFQKRVSEKPTHDKITVDLSEMMKLLEGSDVFDRYEARLLEGVPHLPLVYEEHLLDGEKHQPTIDSVCDYLGIQCATVKTSFQKVSPKKIRDSVANYDELAKALEGSSYAKYLD